MYEQRVLFRFLTGNTISQEVVIEHDYTWPNISILNAEYLYQLS
jgi:hypothetical protein